MSTRCEPLSQTARLRTSLEPLFSLPSVMWRMTSPEKRPFAVATMLRSLRLTPSVAARSSTILEGSRTHKADRSARALRRGDLGKGREFLYAVDRLLLAEERHVAIVQISFRRDNAVAQAFDDQFDDAQNASWTRRGNDFIRLSSASAKSDIAGAHRGLDPPYGLRRLCRASAEIQVAVVSLPCRSLADCSRTAI